MGSFRDIIRGGSSAPKGVYGSRDVEDNFLIGTVRDAFEPVLAKIRKIHGEVDIAAYRNGFCFGLLDPISNIIVNSAISSKADVPCAASSQQAADDMAMRSLIGLVAFLTYLFPYLPEQEALGYLDAADADLIVACLLIVQRRGMCEFDPCSPTSVTAFETALRCASVAARYPDPKQLVQRWKALSHDLYRYYKPSSRLQDMIMEIPDMLNDAGTSSDSIALVQSWIFAKLRLKNLPLKVLPPARAAMKRMLLATIHGFYLLALAMLPTAELRSRYHYSMLMGGYCYGPFDPVSNILFNTLWFNQKVPANHQLNLQMVSTECLWRIVAQSLYGLVSFLCTRYCALTPDLAMQRLLVARADLRAADPNLPAVGRRHNVSNLNWYAYNQVGSGTTGDRISQHKGLDLRTPSASAEEAYAAAAFHPDPSAHRELLGSPSMMGILESASSLLQKDCVLSAEDILSLNQLFVRSPPIELDQLQKPVRNNKGMQQHKLSCRSRFWDEHDRVCIKVKAALDALNKNKEFKYRLHIICGVNEFVSGPKLSKNSEVTAYNPSAPFKFYHSHINFLATCAESKPILFFAQCSNHGKDEAWCIPVEPPRPLAEHVRCIYCEQRGTCIVHPTMKGFHGRDREFEKVLHGESLFDSSNISYSNNRIITCKQVFIDWVHSVRDDYIYYADAPDGAEEDDEDEDEVDIF